MDPEKFITIDDQAISLRQALGYLRNSGDLQQFLMRILRQYIIEQEIQKRAAIEVDSTRLEQSIINFRLQNQLIQPDRFDKWLETQGLNYSTFRNQFATGLKIEQLKAEVTSEKIEEYFNQNKTLFEQVVLSRIVVDDYAEATELKRQITEEDASFEALAKERSKTNDRLFNGMMGTVVLGQLPEAIRQPVSAANPGDLIGPVEFEGRYSILRLEQRMPATLDGALKRQLQDQFFEQWWQMQLQNKSVKLQVD